MSTTNSSANHPDSQRSRRGFSWWIGLFGLVSVIGTLALWFLGNLSAHFVPPVGREVFGNIPLPLKSLFYVGTAAFIGVCFYLFWLRSRRWQRGQSESRTGCWRERTRQLWAGLTMRTLFRDRAAGMMHALVFYGFVLLFLGTVTLEIDHLLPTGWKFLEGGVYQGYSAILDLAGVGYLVGLGWALGRRYLTRPLRLRTKTKPEDLWVLTLLVLIGVTGFLTEAARISWQGRPDFEVWSLVGYPLSWLFPASGAELAHRILWVGHAALFLVFLVALPSTKLRHAVTSPANLFLAPHTRPKGAMRPVPNLLEVEDIDTIGAASITDFSWKDLFDTDACTHCGRCTAVCPANLTAKPLDPREIILKTGEVMNGQPSVNGGTASSSSNGSENEIDLLFRRITSEELFSCTTCRACDEICPVGIEIVDKILDMRRYLTLMDSDFPSELGKAFINLENQGNPWGMSSQTRAGWTELTELDIPVLGQDGVTRAEYLWWVGCAGSFDDRNLAVTLALAKLFRRAELDFAILGPAERCNGDPARRAGNEFLFQQLALENISTFDQFEVSKVVTACPHCFNTLAHEYPQLGGEYEVLHHTELLSQLIASGQLRWSSEEPSSPRSVTYHDPCYLGRYNDRYLAPRHLAAQTGSELVEMPRHGTRALCCGAGGARFWLEEKTGKKVNLERAQEAAATEAEEVTVACPFCLIMLDDGLKELGRTDIEVNDLAVMVERSSRPLTAASSTSERF